MKNVIKRHITLVLLLINSFSFSQETSKIYWKITSKNAISFNALEQQNLPYNDNIEMDAKRVTYFF